MTTLWTEKFSPSRIEPFSPTLDEFNKAWAWMFEKDESGEFKRAGLALIVVHCHSLDLRKRGIKDSAKCAAVGVWKRYGRAVKLPVRA